MRSASASSSTTAATNRPDAALARALVRRRLIALAGALVGTVLLVELFTLALFHWPLAWRGRVPASVERLLLRYHEGFLMAAPVQFRPECSEPDPDLLYRLRPGRCRFAGDEFDTTFVVSSRHLREDREVPAPDLLVLGDSVALGWGVEREQAFPAQLAQALGAREVVVANSSYGTVRELLLLRRLALADFGAVVLQYHANDLRENRAFLAAGRHRPSPPEEYAHWVAVSERIRGKVFLKRTRHWFALFWSDLVGPAPPPEAPAGPADHARALMASLAAFAADLRSRPVLILAEGLGADEAAFVAAVNSAPRSAVGPVRAVEVASRLAAGDRFDLDPHWRASGHRAVAAALARELRPAASPAP